MEIHSLGYRTDLMFHRYDGEVRDAGDCLVIRTPNNPTFRWGNMLLFPRPPVEGDFERWEERFQQELGRDVGHRVFAWDIDPGDPLADDSGSAAAFTAAGFRLERAEILAADTADLRPPARPHPELEIRVLGSERDWREVIDLQVLCREEREDEIGYRRFRERKMTGYRRMQADGLGAWYGGFVSGRMVADMGLFVEGGVGRYQHVETHPEWRRRGIAGTMIHRLARRAFERGEARTLVLAVDPDGPAASLYKSLGFRLREIGFGVELIRSGQSGPG